MKYSTIKLLDVANGTGIRVSLFVSGCRNQCKGCFNPEAWDFKHGHDYTEETEKQIINTLRYSNIYGLSVLGGDPLEPENAEAILPLLIKVKELFPTKPTWVYTGYLYDKVKDWEIMHYIDVLVDGRFIIEQKDPSLKFRGSRNQRIIDVKRSLEAGEVVLHEFKDFAEERGKYSYDY